MLYFEPGTYEEFVGKVSNLRVKPSPDVWPAINQILRQKRIDRYWKSFQQLGIAASIAFLLFVNIFLYFSNSKSTVSFVSLLPISSTDNPTGFVSIFSNDNINSNNPTTGKNFISNTLKNDLVIEKDVNQNSFILNIIEAQRLSPIEGKLSIQLAETIEPFTNRTKNRADIKNEQYIVADIKKPISNPNKTSKWGFSAYLNPSYSHHTNAALNFKQNPSEKGVLMWAGDVQIKRRINSYISISTGLALNPVGQNIDNLILIKSNGLDDNLTELQAVTSYGSVSLNNSNVGVFNFSNISSSTPTIQKSSYFSTTGLSQRIYYLEFPFIASTNISKKSFDLEFKVGCSAGILVFNKFEVATAEERFIGENVGIRKYSASTFGAINLSYPIANNINLEIEPGIRLSLSSVSQTYQGTYPFSASIKFGFGYKF